MHAQTLRAARDAATDRPAPPRTRPLHFDIASRPPTPVVAIVSSDRRDFYRFSRRTDRTYNRSHVPAATSTHPARFIHRAPTAVSHPRTVTHAETPVTPGAPRPRWHHARTQQGS